GLFAIYAGLSKENVNLVLDLIARELGKIRTEGIGAEELRRAKDQLKGNFLLSLESVTARMSRLGKLEMYLGKVIPPEEVVQRIEEVTPEQVRSLAATLFRADRLAMATVGTWCDVTAWREATSRLG
ncbi:MAG TPA: peptidase M16, partial [Peptococcaceae bacterium]|nr:peptidase M16 [Peptococcaceae bacterium]